MKRYSLIFSILASVLIMSCSKEEDFPLVNKCSSIELELSSIGYKCEIINENDNKTNSYLIDIPCEGAAINLIVKSEVDARLKIASIDIGCYNNNKFDFFNHIIPEKMSGFKYVPHSVSESGRIDECFFWTFNSEIGNYSHTEFYKLKCEIPEHDGRDTKIISLSLESLMLNSCTLIFRQTPNL